MQEDKKIKLEFTLDEGEKREDSLVFEEEQQRPAPAAKPKKSRKAVSSSRTEFSVPEKFGHKAPAPESAPAKNGGSELLGDVPRTYVPKFTDASDGYRVREKTTDEEKPVRRSVGRAKPEIIVVPYVKAATTEEIEEKRTVDDAKIVTVGAPPPPENEIHSTVFKFEKKAEAVEAPEVAAEPKPEPEVEPTTVFSSPRVYTIPNPEIEGHGGAVSPYGATLPASPETVGDGALSKGARASEFTASSQRDSFKDRFLDGIMSVKVRLFASAVLVIALLFIENLWLFGVDVPKWLGISEIPGSMALLDLHVIVALFLLAIPEVVSSVHKLLCGRATPELFITVGAVASVIYSVVAVIKAPTDRYPLFGLLYSFVTVGAIVASLYKKHADFSAFKTVSSSDEKRIVDRKLTRALPEENVAVDGKVEGYKSKIARVYRAGFISDFFKRCGKCAENSKNVLMMLVATLGISVVAGVVAFFVSSGDIMVGTMVFATVVMLGFPAFTLLTHKIPFFHASRTACEEKSAVIGESTLYDYSGVDVLTFRDTEIFTDEDVTLQRIMLYGKSENLEKAMHQMSAIFAVVGGPLENMFLEAVDRRAPRAANIKIEDDGIMGAVGGCDVRAGTLEYMVRCGIGIPEDHVKENASLRSTKVMYAAENGEVYAKFYIRYTLSEDFTKILPVLLDDGITPLVYTRDPNVTNELFRNLTAGSDDIRILKRYNLPEAEERVYSRVSAGLVTTGDKSNVINMILLSKKYVRFQNRMAITELSAGAVGAALGVILSLTGMTAVPSICLAAWQIAWCAALFFMSRGTLGASPDSAAQDN